MSDATPGAGSIAPWVPIERQLLESSVWEADPVARVLWVSILIIASEPGRRGCIDMTVRALASRACLSLEDTERALAVLTAPDPQSRSREEDGRRLVPLDPARPWGWRVVTWDRRQEDRSRAMAALRKQRQRARESADGPLPRPDRHVPSRSVTPRHAPSPQEGEGDREGDREGEGEPEGGSRSPAAPAPLRGPTRATVPSNRKNDLGPNEEDAAATSGSSAGVLGAEFDDFISTYPKRSSDSVLERAWACWLQLSAEARLAADSAVGAFSQKRHRDLRSIPNADAWLESFALRHGPGAS